MSSAVMYFGRVSVKRQCIVTMVINRQGREDSMEDDGRINLSRSWKKPRNIDPPRFLFFRILFQLFRCSLCDLVTRNLRVTLCIYIYTYICKVSFYSILFFFFSTLLYLIFIADHVLKNRSNLRYLRDARFNLLERWRQIASDFFYSRSSREITFFFEKNNQAAFSIDGRRNIWLKSEA